MSAPEKLKLGCRMSALGRESLIWESGQKVFEGLEAEVALIRGTVNYYTAECLSAADGGYG